MVAHVPLTLDAFRASRKDSTDLRWIFGDDDASEPLPGYTYADDGGCICLDKNNMPYLVIYNQEWWDKPLEELEEILYNEFYLPEICGMKSNGLEL